MLIQNYFLQLDPASSSASASIVTDSITSNSITNTSQDKSECALDGSGENASPTLSMNMAVGASIVAGEAKTSKAPNDSRLSRTSSVTERNSQAQSTWPMSPERISEEIQHNLQAEDARVAPIISSDRTISNERSLEQELVKTYEASGCPVSPACSVNSESGVSETGVSSFVLFCGQR